MYGFQISTVEIQRRIHAYTVLITSFFVSFTIALLFVWGSLVSEFFSLVMSGLLILLLFLLLTRQLTIRFFDRFQRTRLVMQDHKIKRITAPHTESFSLLAVKKVVVLWTTRRSLRQIQLVFPNQVSQYFDGIAYFEKFKAELLKRIEPQTIVVEKSEPFDYDHPFFYPVLGTSLGIITVYLCKVLITLPLSQIKYVYGALSLYTLLLGVYFFVKKPLAASYGRKYALHDYVFGAIFVAVALTITIWSW